MKVLKVNPGQYTVSDFTAPYLQGDVELTDFEAHADVQFINLTVKYVRSADQQQGTEIFDKTFRLGSTITVSLPPGPYNYVTFIFHYLDKAGERCNLPVSFNFYIY